MPESMPMLIPISEWPRETAVKAGFVQKLVHKLNYYSWNILKLLNSICI